ncbi:hypothetical protein HGRIS_000072 [Hohenbuehelia grisea]|uniref:Uncharacterized protein n=1 Tax=Hohenbuehelia grisea TaxID=104357 RepID=A0ABR3JQR6_9AGAR
MSFLAGKERALTFYDQTSLSSASESSDVVAPTDASKRTHLDVSLKAGAVLNFTTNAWHWIGIKAQREIAFALYCQNRPPSHEMNVVLGYLEPASFTDHYSTTIKTYCALRSRGRTDNVLSISTTTPRRYTGPGLRLR